MSCLGYRRRITAHYPQIPLFAGLAYGCVVMRLYVCVYTIVCSSAMCSYDYILISYISNVVVSSHAHSSHMSFEFKPIEFDGFRTSHVYSSQRGWGLLWDFGWVYHSSLIFIVFSCISFIPIHLNQSKELLLELDWFFLIIYMYNILIHWHSSILCFGSCNSI